MGRSSLEKYSIIGVSGPLTIMCHEMAMADLDEAKLHEFIKANRYEVNVSIE